MVVFSIQILLFGNSKQICPKYNWVALLPTAPLILNVNNKLNIGCCFHAYGLVLEETQKHYKSKADHIWRKIKNAKQYEIIYYVKIEKKMWQIFAFPCISMLHMERRG